MILESIRIAIGMLRLHKMRAFLTMLGVIIGVMSVSMIVLISEGFKQYINRQFDSLSADTIFLVVDRSRMFRGETSTIENLTDKDKEFLRNRARSVGTVSAVAGAPNQMVRYEDRESKDTQVVPIDQYYSEVVTTKMIEGREIEARDLEQMRNVAVISEATRDLLFPNGGALGKMITLQGITLEVVGVMENQDQGGPGANNPRMIYIPLSTAQRKWIGGRDYMALFLKPKPGFTVEETMDEVWELMMAKSGNKPIYRLDSSASILGVFQGVIGAAGVILAGVAALSLLVGGIGIMNIMLVSVTERTREIGLRMAVGAKRGSILLQFLIESAILSLVGGLIGMTIAWGLGKILTIVTIAIQKPSPEGLSAPFPLVAAVFAAAFSAVIGMVFGFFPAVSASKLDPIVALRYE